MSFAFLMVLPKLMRSGDTPSASTLSSSYVDAMSNEAPLSRINDSTSGAGFAFTA